VVALGGLAVAAALAVIGYVGRRAPIERTVPEATTRAVAVATPVSATRTLADGSVARLKDGAEMAEVFSPTERRVKLLRGEAFFIVTKDSARPFYVEAGNVTVRAVGTAFSVNFAAHAVDVLVTEGTVQVTPPTSVVPETAPLVEAGHRAVVARAAEPSVVVTTVSREEIARSLAWNEPMLDLAGATLGELVTRFSERSGRRIEVSDPELASVRIGGRFPNEDVDGFLRALETVYDVKAERRADGSVTLRRAR
jgi:transmembrane sensor